MRSRNYRSYLLAVLALVYTFKSIDLAVFGILMQSIQVDLQLSDTQMGFLSGIAFALFYATLGIPIALWADRGNRISITAITLGLWSALIIFCGLATTYMQLLLARIGVAVGESGSIPVAQSLIADYYSREERPKAMSHYMLGGPISVIVGYGAAGWINEWYGWRMAFFALGVPGILLTLVVYFSLHEPRVTRNLARTKPEGAASIGGYLRVFAALWGQVAYRHLVMGFTLIYLFSNGIGLWVPAFLIRTYHISTGELGSWYSLVWGLGGGLGTYLGGHLATRFAENREQLQLNAMAVCLITFIPLYMGIYLSSHVYVAFSLMLIGALIYGSLFGPLFAMIQEIVPAGQRALSIALMMFIANLIGMGLGPLSVGALSDVLRPAYGDGSLRMSLLIWTPGYIWAAFHLLRAGKYVHGDIAALRTELTKPIGI